MKLKKGINDKQKEKAPHPHNKRTGILCTQMPADYYPRFSSAKGPCQTSARKIPKQKDGQHSVLRTYASAYCKAANIH